MKKFKVNTSKPYNVLIGENNLKDIGILVQNVCDATKVVIVSDNNVSGLYSKIVEESLNKAGFKTSLFVIKAGESSKNLTTTENLYHHFCKNGIKRSDLIIALGGGVVGDITGFAASSFLRGINFINIPTSLLSQVDSCIGGKVAVNLNEGKNLVGCFLQPKLVLIDVKTLKTLPYYYLNDAMAEVIKYGIIKDYNLFTYICENCAFDHIENIIFWCLDIKRKLVEEDEFDNGNRMLLNFGHTIGHALEKYYNYKTITHGKAVATGMALITKFSENLNLTKKGTYSQIIKALNKYSLPSNSNVPLDNIYKICENDKKNIYNKINLILLHNVGSSYIYKLPQNKILDFMKGNHKV